MRRVLAPVLALLAVLLVASSARADAPSAQIVGGGFASAGEIPYQVLVLPGDRLCGGSLLDSTHVATAAHCVYDHESGTVVARGSPTSSAGSSTSTSSTAHRTRRSAPWPSTPTTTRPGSPTTPPC